MPRSPESIARRREAHRAWRATPEGQAYMAAWHRAHPKPPGSTTAWRRAHPAAARRARAIEEERRRERLQRRPEPLPLLYPELQHGHAVAFWEDELRLDLAQERELAILEGRDPVEAVGAYRARELSWREHAGPLLLEVAA